jgi:hypothetical protein
MVKSPLARILICLAVLALIAVTALAFGTKQDIVLINGGRMAIATKTPSVITRMDPRLDAGLKTIAGNLSTYPFATFFCCLGDTIAQGGSSFPFQTWTAVPFTPTANATVTRIKAAVGVYFGTTGAFELSIREDNAGVPGRVIKSFHIAAPIVFGSCCVLDAVNDTAGLPVTAGTQYWLAATTTAKDTNFLGAWAQTSTDMRSHPVGSWCKSTGTQCGSNNGRWVVGSSADPMPAYAVLGQ